MSLNRTWIKKTFKARRMPLGFPQADFAVWPPSSFQWIQWTSQLWVQKRNETQRIFEELDKSSEGNNT